MSDLKKFAVTYTIDYQHRVVVGVTASDQNAAVQIASNAFDEGVIWDDKPDLPLLFDDYEEVEGETLEFSAEEVQSFPEPDSSVKQLKANQFAFYCAQALLSGEMESALEFAKKALPQFAVSQPEETIWSVKSDNGCDPFEVIAANREDALRDALYAIGWSVSPKETSSSSDL
jgi:1,2-phenylacetyl-CoA epoxidase PaaB subunit